MAKKSAFVESDLDLQSFERWMREIDSLCLSWYGMSVHDLPDMCFRDAYDGGTTAETFALEEFGTLEQLKHLMFG